MATDLHLYSGSGLAIRSEWRDQRNQVDVEHTSYSYLGHSHDAAMGWAMTELKRAFPSNEGYSHHDVTMYEISLAQLEAWAAAIKAGPATVEGAA